MNSGEGLQRKGVRAKDTRAEAPPERISSARTTAVTQSNPSDSVMRRAQVRTGCFGIHRKNGPGSAALECGFYPTFQVIAAICRHERCQMRPVLNVAASSRMLRNIKTPSALTAGRTFITPAGKHMFTSPKLMFATCSQSDPDSSWKLCS